MTMHWGWGLSLVALVATGCTSAGKLNIRPVGKQSSLAGQPQSARVALAHGQLALGNVALALEQFRRAERESPDSVAALSGMAECYRLMGRLELTRRYYEQALAIAPDDATLYLALASALDQEGKSEAARALRLERVVRLAGKTLPVVTEAGSVARMPEPMVKAPWANSVTVTLPPPLPAAPAPSPSRVRLERMSSGEVALVSQGRSPWTARQVATTPRATMVVSAKQEPMVVLNAARIAGIAARTRDYLISRGLGSGNIGDAPSTRAQTLILYPSSAHRRAQRIAAQFPFIARLEVREGPLTLLIGRDAEPRRAGRAG